MAQGKPVSQEWTSLYFGAWVPPPVVVRESLPLLLDGDHWIHMKMLSCLYGELSFVSSPLLP
jgi:hypothetical protein